MSDQASFYSGLVQSPATCKGSPSPPPPSGGGQGHDTCPLPMPSHMPRNPPYPLPTGNPGAERSSFESRARGASGRAGVTRGAAEANATHMEGWVVIVRFRDGGRSIIAGWEGGMG